MDGNPEGYILYNFQDGRDGVAGHVAVDPIGKLQYR
jgi:hypothetical protein